MALSETDNSDCNSDSSAEGTLKADRKEKLLTKIVVRRLPPSMNKETFLDQVSPLPEYDYMYFVKADMSLGEFAFSRAYINFKNAADIFIFKEKFDNYIFLDAKGNEYAAVVEFAPFSRISKRKNKRPDPKCGTIENDPVYKEFIESLTEITTENEEKPEYCFQPSIEDKKEITNTPLLDYIKQRRIDRQKIKQEKREERKRREIERKRIKDDDRKIREKSYVSSSKKISSKSPNLDVIEENKTETNIKSRDRKVDDYKSKHGKSNYRERDNYHEKRTQYISSKTIHNTNDRKSPSKIKPRTSSYGEKESRKLEFKNSRKDDVSRHKKEERDDKVAEKKVKKYSERREERKNEFKRSESKPEPGQSSSTKDDKSPEHKSDSKPDEPKMDGKETKSRVETPKKKQESENRMASDGKDLRNKENDPRTQRRIRNKDRPAMQIYQPGMGLGRNRKPNSESSSKDNGGQSSSDAGKDAPESKSS